MADPASLNQQLMRRLCVFCGARSGTNAAFAAAAAHLGKSIGNQGIELVYGGGANGLMGVLATAAMQAGARVVGIMPSALIGKEALHPALSEMKVVDSLAERKAVMIDLADAFLAMPGGLGTWNEILEVANMFSLGLLAKPCGLLNVDGFYNPLLAQAEAAFRVGLLRQNLHAVLHVESEPEILISSLASATTALATAAAKELPRT